MEFAFLVTNGVPVPVLPMGSPMNLATSGTSQFLNLPSGAKVIEISVTTATWVRLTTLSTLVAHNPATTVNVAGVTKAAGQPINVQATTHGYLTGDRVTIRSVVGSTEINNNTYTITRVDANNFTLDGTSNTSITAYISGGELTPATSVFIPANGALTLAVETNTVLAFIQDTGAGVISVRVIL